MIMFKGCANWTCALRVVFYVTELRRTDRCATLTPRSVVGLRPHAESTERLQP